MIFNLFSKRKQQEIHGKISLSASQHNAMLETARQVANREFHDYIIKNPYSTNAATISEYAKFAANGSCDAVSELIKGFNRISNFWPTIATPSSYREVLLKSHCEAFITICENSIYPVSRRLVYLALNDITSKNALPDSYLPRLINKLKQSAAYAAKESVESSYMLAKLYVGCSAPQRFAEKSLNSYFNEHKTELDSSDRLKLALMYAEEGTPDAIDYIVQEIAAGRYKPSENMNWQTEEHTKAGYLATQATHYLMRTIELAITFNAPPSAYNSFDSFFEDFIMLHESVTPGRAHDIKDVIINTAHHLVSLGNTKTAQLLHGWYTNGFTLLHIQPDSVMQQQCLNQLIKLRCVPYAGNAINITNNLLVNSDREVDQPRKKLAASLGHVGCATMLALNAITNKLGLAEIDKWMTQALVNDNLDTACFKTTKIIILIRQLLATCTQHLTQEHIFPYYLKWHSIMASKGNEDSLQHLINLHVNTLAKETEKKAFKTLIKKIEKWGKTTDYLDDLLSYVTKIPFPSDKPIFKVFKELQPPRNPPSLRLMR